MDRVKERAIYTESHSRDMQLYGTQQKATEMTRHQRLEAAPHWT